jgi:O-antigen/teichoic acid export membrane protein
LGSLVNEVIDRKRGLRLLFDERLLTHNLIVGAGTVGAGLLGVAFQALVSHQLSPSDYGAVFVVVTLITFVGMPASAFTLLMARETSRDLARGNRRRSVTLLRRGNHILLILGTGAAVVIALFSPIISGFIGTQWQLILAAAIGLPFTFAFPLLMGELQGEQHFGRYAGVMAGQAALKLALAISLGATFGPIGIVAGISAASAATYLVALGLARPRRRDVAEPAWWRPALRYLAVVVPSTLALAVLLTADVVLVKHYFGAGLAGEYSAVAAIGRAIFWGASGTAAVLFPKLVFRAAQGNRGTGVVLISMALVAVAGFCGFLFLSVTGHWLITAFAGNPYVGGTTYLPWYAIAMTLLGGTAVLIAAHQSSGRATFLFVLIPATLLEPILIAAFHQTLLQVAQVIDLAMAVAMVGLGAWFVIEQRSPSMVVEFAQPAASPQMEAVK